MSGGFIMATGIVSIAMRLDGHVGLSIVLLVVTAAGWSYGALLLVRRGPERGLWRAETWELSSLTAVAGTAVLGTGLTLLGWLWAGWTLLAIAAVLCPILLSSLAKARERSRNGAAFLLVVAPQSVAVLAASLAARLALSWLAFAALFAFAFGLRGYAQVLARFDRGQVRTGAGDHWVAGGAIAISTLACAELFQATEALRATGAIEDVLRITSLVLWGLTMAWLPVLIGGEVLSIRRRYDVRRWATVFPLGMYSVMSFAVGTDAGSTWVVDFARAWAWVALLAWIAAAAGAARSLSRHPYRVAISCYDNMEGSRR
jgi:hypothetical protein